MSCDIQTSVIQPMNNNTNFNQLINNESMNNVPIMNNLTQLMSKTNLAMIAHDKTNMEDYCFRTPPEPSEGTRWVRGERGGGGVKPVVDL